MNTLRYQRHPDLRLTALEGEGVVLHLKERRYFSVNESGLVLLEALREPRSLEDLVGSLLAEYEVTRQAAEATTRAFLAQCLEAAVVTEQPG